MERSTRTASGAPRSPRSASARPTDAEGGPGASVPLPRSRPLVITAPGSPTDGESTVPRSKLRLVPLRPELVGRPRLLSRLVGSDARLVLVSAQAGFGKSVLLAQWAAVDARRFAYVSLEAADDDPVSLWNAIVMSLRQVAPTFGTSAEPMLRSLGPLALEAMVRRLLIELESLAEPVVLVLDDYQLIRDRACQESVELLVHRAPTQLQVVLSTRFDRPLRVGRIRASGDLLELRARDLAFTPDETDTLARTLLAAPWGPDESAVLHERTEGWPAGLQLASLGLAATGDRAAFLRSFGGSNLHVIDYLTEVVLASLSEELRRFLVDTSMLAQLSGPLCNAVTGRDDAAEVLLELDRLNLFVVPVGEGRTSYRYHHLFAGFLEQELAATGAGHRADLHRRASAGYAASGEVGPAIEHALAAVEVDVAADLVLAHWAEPALQGRSATVATWLDAFPAGHVEASAALSVVRAYVCGLDGRQDEARRAVVQALTAAPSDRRMPDGAGSVEHSVALVRAMLVAGDAGAQQEAARTLADRHADLLPQFQALSTYATGLALFLTGEHEEALPHLQRAADLAAGTGAWGVEVDAIGLEAQVALARSRPDEAHTLARRALARAQEHGLADLPPAGYHLATLGATLTRCGRVVEGDVLLARGTEQFGEWDRLLAAHLRLMRVPVRRSLGDADGAKVLMEEATALLARCGGTGFIGGLVPGLERSLTTSHRRGDGRTDLTDRELDVLRLMAQGLTKRDIAHELFLSFNTIHSHTKSIYTRLDVGNRTAAIARARSLELI
ncbi:LuxR C-terminal-related transcriptional regulator [Nocardioides sp. Soil805]|uniref:LuxR C-terminal-related transcriptional regulator n=1 Tax=Nocardioides sp. Soil805 TaxID=1736416 RepID=UPI0007029F7E|nr:LuxR C-terminal-related transcriptional regulator [Nocardioides sp. Soil805]KRF34143.1 hypothetical protein ASG94_15535 [Nocardioides sp. Soil805]